MDKLQQLIQQMTAQAVEKDSSIESNLTSNIAKETGSSLIDGLKSVISGGNLGDLSSLFNQSNTGSSSANPIVQNIISSLTSKLNSNVGLDNNAANGFASTVIPQIIQMLSNKIQQGDFNINDILGSLNGGAAGSMLDQNGDGKVGIDDAISAVTKGKLGDMLGGFFKK